MVRKRKSYTWIIVSLAIVLILWGVLHYIETKDRGGAAKESTSDAVVTAASPATPELKSINEITIQYPKEHKYVQLKKDAGSWYVLSDGTMYLAEQQTANQVVEEITGLKPEHLIAQGESHYADYMVDAENALRVTASENGAVSADVFIGKYDTQSGSGQTFVRLAGQDGIYAVNAFLRASFQSVPEYYRNKRLCNISYRKMKSIEFRYPADSSFVITQPQPDVWLIDGKAGKEGEVEKFAGTLGFLMSGDYADETQVELPENPMYTLMITGTDSQVFYIYAYRIGNSWYLKSSYDSQTLWNGSQTDLLKRAFPSKKNFN